MFVPLCGLYLLIGFFSVVVAGSALVALGYLLFKGISAAAVRLWDAVHQLTIRIAYICCRLVSSTVGLVVLPLQLFADFARNTVISLARRVTRPLTEAQELHRIYREEYRDQFRSFWEFKAAFDAANGKGRKGRIVLELNAKELATELGLKTDEIDPSALQIQAPFALRRRGVEGKIVAGDHVPDPDRPMLRALARAHIWTADLRRGKSLSDIAAATSHSESYVRTRAQLAFLAPKIQKAILVGSQPPELTLEKIIRKPIPLDWDMQARIYGFSQDLNHP